MNRNQKIENIIFKTELLKDFTVTLLKNVFKVYTTKNTMPHEKTTYIYIEKNNKIGYIQANDFFGLDFSTVHKPNYKCGTGYKINDDGITKPTIKHAESTFRLMPHWASNNDVQHVKKYKDFKEYMERETVLSYFEIVL